MVAERSRARLAGLDRRPTLASADADAETARDYAGFERRGTPMGANDLWIAAQALACGATLVTDNEREFQRVPI